MNTSVTYPVQVLHEHITELEAAISVCLADPGHKPVHKLRTEIRRIEALLLLLALVPGLPEHRKGAAALFRALAKLRRAAGQVRDLDVHRKMLEALAEPEPNPNTTEHATYVGGSAQNGSAHANSAATARKKDRTISPDPVWKAATALRKRLGRQRDKAAGSLQQLLKRRQAKTAKAAQALLKALDPAQETALPAPDLLRDANAVLLRDGLLGQSPVSALNKDDLHTVRKAAKAARYVAEALPDDPALVQAARSFEALQEAGGEWHDALELARSARRRFGKAHELTATYRKERNRRLKAYRAVLTSQVKATERAKPHADKRPRSARTLRAKPPRAKRQSATATA